MQKKTIFFMSDSSTVLSQKTLKGIFAYAQRQPDWIIEFENRGVYEESSPDFLDRPWDGVISRSYSKKSSEFMSRLSCPLVRVGDDRSDEVQYDNRMNADIAVNYFLECGHKTIAYFSDSACWCSDQLEKYFVEKAAASRVRCLTYPAEMKKKPFPTGSCEDPASEEHFTRWIESLPKPIGIMGGCYLHGIRLINTCRRLDLKIPEEVSILIAGHDPDFCESVIPSLTAIENNSFLYGFEAARLLDLKMRRMPLPDHPVIIPPQGLVIRNSTEVFQSQKDVVYRAIRFIRENAVSGLTVQDTARHFSVSRRTLEREIRRVLGCSPSAEINRVQMECAVRLLKTTDMPIYEIAGLTGFSSSEYFAIVFRRHFRKTPSEYRKDYLL